MDSLEVLEFIPGVLQTLTWGVILWGWWSLKRIFVTHIFFREYVKEANERFTKIEILQQDYSADQEHLRQKLDLMPTVKDLQDISLYLKEMEGDIKGMNNKMEGLNHATRRLERAVDLFTQAHLDKRKP